MVKTMYRILIAEDDSVIASSVSRHLLSWGYETKCTEDFKAVLTDFAAFNPHMVLLDISLPFFNGYYWCSEIRKISKVPVIFISSASENINIITAVNMGGDDFISKPFNLDVLTAKVNAMIRRTYDFTGQTGIIEANGAILNTNDTTLMYNGKKIELTKNEYRITQVLMENKGKSISRDALMEKLWETDSFIDDNTLTVNVTRLRKKLDEAGLNNFIRTKKGIGYMVE